MSTSTIWGIFVLTMLLIRIDAGPTCTYVGVRKQDVICSPGDTDYVLERGLVSDNNRTLKVILNGCRITDVQYESFENLNALKHLDLSENKIRKLKLGVLDGDLQVTYLNLSHNLLTDFPLGLFDQKPNLEVLDLKGNMINYIELGVFDLLKKLQYIDLSNNDIIGKNLNVYIFDQSTKIKTIDFSRNDMSETPNNMLEAFEMLESLHLDGCQFTEVPSFATMPNLKTLKNLVLSANQISKLDNAAVFTNLINLELLDLSNNVIDEVNENVFKSMTKLKKIVLRKNKIVVLPDTLFQNMPKLVSIDLSHNLIEYIPVNAFRAPSLRNLNVADNRFTYLQDNFCLELRNSGARLTKFYFNHNPWQCACLKEFLKEVKLFKIEYNVVQYNGEEAVCVTTNENNCKRHQTFNEIFHEIYDNINKHS